MSFTSAFHHGLPTFGKRLVKPTMPNGAGVACNVPCGHPACSAGCAGYGQLPVPVQADLEHEGAAITPHNWDERVPAGYPVVWSVL